MEEGCIALLCPKCFHEMRWFGGAYICVVGCWRPPEKARPRMTFEKQDADEHRGWTLFNKPDAPEFEEP